MAGSDEELMGVIQERTGTPEAAVAFADEILTADPVEAVFVGAATAALLRFSGILQSPERGPVCERLGKLLGWIQKDKLDNRGNL